MSNHPWLKDESRQETRAATRKAIKKVDRSRQVACRSCGSSATKMELMTGESGFKRVGKSYICKKCFESAGMEVAI